MNGFFLLIPFFLIRFALLFFFIIITRRPPFFNPGRSLYPEYTRGGLLWKPYWNWKT